MTTNVKTRNLLDLLQLENVGPDFYRTTYTFVDPYGLYGGQVAAQALLAAGSTLPEFRAPHSLHGYFLRPGDASQPVDFHVERDRDGRSYSMRRVTAVQNEKAIFTMSTSFHIDEDSVEGQATAMPESTSPEDSRAYVIPRMFSFEGRLPRQPHRELQFPARFWSRCTAPLADPLFHACALTYFSDISNGLSRFETNEYHWGASLDHTIWFHRPFDVTEWVLHELTAHTIGKSRGMYSGSLFDREGLLIASMAQETIFREGPTYPNSRQNLP